MKIALFGPPGAGKGTQSKLISEKFSIPSISMGDLLRAEVRKGTALGKEAKTLMDEGQLVPDSVVIGMLRDRLQGSDCDGGFILDGFPRAISQATVLDEFVKLDAVINLSVDDRFLIQRITDRRMCPCGTAYHLVFNPPIRPGVCDDCGEKLYQRDDDTEETVLKRLKVYSEQTKPVLEFYRKRGVLREIDGNKSIACIRHALIEILDSLPQ